MTVAAIKTKAESQLGTQFAQTAGALPGSGWVGDLRQQAFDRFAARGLPHRRIEEWKYTDLRERLRDAPPPAVDAKASVTVSAIDAALGPLATVEADRLVFVDGAWRADLSTPSLAADVFEMKPMADTLRAAPVWLKGKFDADGKGAVAALNTAFMSDGALLKVRKGQTPARPVMIVMASASAEPRTTTLRHVVSVEPGGALTLIEAQVVLAGAARATVCNVVTDVTVADDAEVVHVRCIADDGQATTLNTWNTRIGARASYRGFQLTASPLLARNEINATFAGEGSKLDLSGAMLARGTEHVDTTLVVDHAVPHCESRELFKAVLADRSHAVFQGKIIVQPDAQKTDGKQMSQALMLSPEAQFSSKPELEIFADDVVCGHGATCAEIDDDLMFYCRSRGIPADEARAMLTESFIGEALDKIESEAVREALSTLAIAWLRRK